MNNENFGQARTNEWMEVTSSNKWDENEKKSQCKDQLKANCMSIPLLIFHRALNIKMSIELHNLVLNKLIFPRWRHSTPYFPKLRNKLICFCVLTKLIFHRAPSLAFMTFHSLFSQVKDMVTLGDNGIVEHGQKFWDGWGKGEGCKREGGVQSALSARTQKIKWHCHPNHLLVPLVQ